MTCNINESSLEDAFGLGATTTRHLDRETIIVLCAQRPFSASLDFYGP